MRPETFKLNTGALIPAIGLGTWKLKGTNAKQAVLEALRLGYRYIDTADVYGNHHEVGEALRLSGVPRSDIFLTSKIWHDSLHDADVRPNVERFLDELDTPYLDLLLVHWPNRQIPIGETLRAFDDVRRAGLVKSIGVSNFTVRHLEEALDTGIQISMNQVEFHPTLNQQELKTFCDNHEIILTAYSPLGRGKDVTLPIILELAKKYNRSAAQIILNWLLAKNIVVIPKASSEKHLLENFRARDFEIAPEELKKIDAITPNNERIINPAFAEFGGENRLLGGALATMTSYLTRWFL